LTDNLFFKAEAFIKHFNEHQKQLPFCGTNAHHQNDVAEHAIQTVSNIARAMLLHASMHWNNYVKSDLWPMAILYAAYIISHTPKNMCALQMFSLVVWFHVFVLKSWMFGVFLCFCLILSFSRDKSKLDGKLVLEKNFFGI
jgi:hypothetical protein